MVLEYSEYKEIVDVLEKSSAENTYQDLMKKEEKVLDTVNKVIKHYNDNEVKETQFVNQSLSTIVMRFFTVWQDIMHDLTRSDNITDVLKKDDRLFYIGIMCILIATVLFFVDSSR